MDQENETADLAQAYRKSAEDVISLLASNAQTGLTSAEAQARLQRYGPNALRTERPVPQWRKFLAQFTDVLVVLLIAAALISAAIWFVKRDSALPYEAMAILAIVLINALMGYFQQSRAEQAVARLKQMAAAQATVIRDGRQARIPAAELVPGDILLVEEGDNIAADGRIIQSTALHTLEAALTGESLPVAKETAPIGQEAPLGDRSNMVFSGTIVTYGRGRAVVTATGMGTRMGAIAGLLEAAPDEGTPLRRELDLVGRMLGRIVIAIAVIIIGAILYFDEVTGWAGLLDVLILGVALAVAAVPEGLPAIVTAVLSLGVQRMARRNAIVRRLAAVETLGSANAIASDKTGTLTRNEMMVKRVVTASGSVELGGAGYSPTGEARAVGGGAIDETLRAELVRLLAAADRASNAVIEESEGRWVVQGDPMEGALIVAARKIGLDPSELDQRFDRTGEIPFSSARKMMSTIHADTERGQLRAFTKGAPEILIGLCTHELVGNETRPLSEERRDEIRAANEKLAGDAMRTLAIAFRSLPQDAPPERVEPREIEHDLVFLGLVGMIDPPRQEASEAVAKAKSAGIRCIMITGDHPRTAQVIAAELGISRNGPALTGAQIEKMSDEELEEAVRQVSVFARVDPEHKLRIVTALQRNGMIVAMTGDGVNDAPALKTADIGIAMGITGTDVSREAADIVLADDNFATIVAAVEEGRAIFANIRKFLRYLLSSNIGEVMTMFFGVVLADWIGLAQAGSSEIALPLLATQILWINLVTDGAPALALGLDPAEPGTMQRSPRPRDEGVITGRMWSGMLFVGAIMAAGTLLVLDASLPGGFIEGSGTLAYGQTMAFTTLTLFQLFNVFNARSDERSAFVSLFANSWLWLAIGLSLALHLAVVQLPLLQEAFSTVPLSAGDWLICFAIASSVLWLREAAKLLARLARRSPI